ncbi:hypothetical protein [Streptomyces sp. NPDC059786]|uniref:hypothetical protein n=1 Tax=Streptomyces sp. NPDC059786 TaxID=3346946 RepID=UPI003664AF60
MPEEPTVVEPRRDDTAADAESLFSFGLIEEQPVPSEVPPPSIDPFQQPGE